MNYNMTETTNGTREAISTIKDNQKLIFSRLHYMETHGCTFRNYHEKEVVEVNEKLEKMETKMDRLTIDLYKAVAIATGIVSAIMLIARFL